MITLHYELSLIRILDHQASILETRMAIMIMTDQHQCTGTGTYNDNPASIFCLFKLYGTSRKYEDDSLKELL